MDSSGVNATYTQGGTFSQDSMTIYDAYQQDFDMKPYTSLSASAYNSAEPSFRAFSPPASLHGYHLEPLVISEMYPLDPDRLSSETGLSPRGWSPLPMLGDNPGSESVFSFRDVCMTETIINTHGAGVSPTLLSNSPLQSPPWPLATARDVQTEIHPDDSPADTPDVKHGHPCAIPRVPSLGWQNGSMPGETRMQPPPSTSRRKPKPNRLVARCESEDSEVLSKSVKFEGDSEIHLYRAASSSMVRPVTVKRRTTSTIHHGTSESTFYAFRLEDGHPMHQPEPENSEDNTDMHVFEYEPSGFIQRFKVDYTDDAGSKETQYLRRHCFNCQAINPPSWRRSTMNQGKIVCNKCGLYEKTHRRPRPNRFDGLPGGLVTARPRKPSKSLIIGDITQGQMTNPKTETRTLPRKPSTTSFTSTSSENWDEFSASSSSSSPVVNHAPAIFEGFSIALPVSMSSRGPSSMSKSSRAAYPSKLASNAM